MAPWARAPLEPSVPPITAGLEGSIRRFERIGKVPHGMGRRRLRWS